MGIFTYFLLLPGVNVFTIRLFVTKLRYSQALFLNGRAASSNERKQGKNMFKDQYVFKLRVVITSKVVN